MHALLLINANRLHRFLRLSFFNVSDLVEVKGVLLPLVQKNQRSSEMQVRTAAVSPSTIHRLHPGRADQRACHLLLPHLLQRRARTR